MDRFVLFPLLAAAVLGAGLALPVGNVLLLACIPALVLAVISAVHHAEVIAHKVGEPFGTLVLALAVTVIEVALVLSMMLAGGANAATVPRDTIYSAVMIICNGVVGICLLLGGLRHREQLFRIEGTGSGLAALVVMSTLVLVLPSLTTSAPGGSYTASQLLFVAAGSLVLWLVFVFIQTVRHRDYFLPAVGAEDESVHAPPPGTREALISFALLLVALVSVVGLAKLLSPALETLVKEWHAPTAVVGTLIAIIVLAPETWAAIRAARADRLQTSMNLAIGSALASIGLTIPVVVMAAVWLELPLTLGVATKDMALLALTFIVGAITLGSGRTNLMQGAIHLVVFAAFLFLTFVP
ncbi:calcium:proton antiporter [Hydrogenophaga luteola]|uniref:Calcium:proton antiporter n=1 Tax=Hydrogenophaga luteola TaxID=1591122 RepID=A0ABV7W5W0_9BURK